MIKIKNNQYRPNPKVFAAYTEPHRKYHDINHIHYMLNVLDEIKDQIFIFKGLRDKWNHPDFLAVYWAILYHDIVYNVPDPLKQNEIASAAMWVQDSGNWEYSYVVEQAILSTRTHILPENSNIVSKVLVDIDLWALSDEQVYLKNNELIKLENNANDEQWRIGRGNWLKTFLERDRIYYTEPGMNREAEARRILEQDLKNLQNA